MVTIFSIVLVISFELMSLFLDSIVIPVPGPSSKTASTFGVIPKVAPLPVGIAFTIEIAP